MKTLIAALFLATSYCNAQDYKMEVYGDSLTAGFMVEKSADSHNRSLVDIQKILQDLTNLKTSTDAAEKSRLKNQYEKRDKAWPAILKDKLSAKMNIVQLKNMAVSGAWSDLLYYEVEAASYEKDPTLSFIFIGHNDLCHNTGPIADFKKEFKENILNAVALWDANHQSSKLVLMPVGEVQKVYSTLAGYDWFGQPNKKILCEDSWKLFFPYCPQNYKMFKTKKLDDYMVPRIQAIQEVLSEVTELYRKKSLKNEFYFAKDFGVPNYLPKYFSIDCYHLSELGQKTLADELYARLPF